MARRFLKKIEAVDSGDGIPRIMIHVTHFKGYLDHSQMRGFIRDCMLALKESVDKGKNESSK